MIDRYSRQTLLPGIGAFIKTASVGIRLYADWQMIGAAATMYKASANMLEAAGLQATSNTALLGGLAGVTGAMGAVVALLAGGMYAAKELGIHKTTLFRKIRKLNITLPAENGRSKE